MNVIIEKAKPADASALLAYLKQVGGETENLSFGGEGLPISVEAEAEYLASMENSRDNVMFLAKINGEIVGDASLSRMPRRLRHRGDLGIAVAKEYWNQGIGRMLLSAIIDFAVENDFRIIDLQVRSDNFAAIHLYEKFGFRKFGTHPAFFETESGDVPFDYMILELK